MITLGACEPPREILSCVVIILFYNVSSCDNIGNWMHVETEEQVAMRVN